MSEALIRPQVIAEERFRLYGSVLIRPSPGYLLLALIALCMISAGVYFLLSTQYTRTESALGYLIPGSGLSRRYAQRNALVHGVHVEVGRHVARGEPLITLSYDSLSPERSSKSQAQKENLELRQTELRERVRQAGLRHQIALEDAKQKALSLEEEASAVELQIGLQNRWLTDIRDRLARFQEGFARGGLARIEVETLRSDILSGEINLQSMRRDLLARKREIAALVLLQSQLVAEHAALLSNYAEDRLKLQALDLENDHHAGGLVTALTDSVVISLGVSAGEQVGPGEELVVLAAINTHLYAELYVPVDAVGFVASGQQVKIRYDSFPFEKYGAFYAVLEEVSAFVSDPDSLQVSMPLTRPSFRARARLREQSVTVGGQQVALIPGMTFRADVKTQTRSLLEWIFEPLYAIGGASFP